MLVLSRRENETILIPELGITLEVVRIKGNTVRIGIDAPRSIRIVRGELEDRSEQQDDVSAQDTQASLAHPMTHVSPDECVQVCESRSAYEVFSPEKRDSITPTVVC